MISTETLIDHIDFRVLDLPRATRFYDALMPALGLKRLDDGASSWIEYGSEDLLRPFFALTGDPSHHPNATRIAFAAASKADVDHAAAAARGAGAVRMEGPEFCPEYSPQYYAVFFEDPEGNCLEVCCRAAKG